MSAENAQFRAVAGDLQGFGTTQKEALEALTGQLPSDSSTPIMILPFNRGDAFFTAEQQARLQELKAKGDNRTSVEQNELESLVEAAFDATIARTQILQRIKS